MSQGTQPLDLADELRLRRWARNHYVPVEQRQAEWHAIVIDEMQGRDQELAKGDPVPAALRLVPLLNENDFYHQAHPIGGWHMRVQDRTLDSRVENTEEQYQNTLSCG